MQISFILHAGSILTEEFSSGTYVRGLYCDTTLEMGGNSDSIQLDLVSVKRATIHSLHVRSIFKFTAKEIRKMCG